MSCPAWCANEHPDGGVHRRPVGTVTVDRRTLSVVLSQVPDGEPTVLVSGELFVAINPDDSSDMAELMRMLGQPELGVLVTRAAELLAAEPVQVP